MNHDSYLKFSLLASDWLSFLSCSTSFLLFLAIDVVDYRGWISLQLSEDCSMGWVGDLMGYCVHQMDGCVPLRVVAPDEIGREGLEDWPLQFSLLVSEILSFFVILYQFPFISCKGCWWTIRISHNLHTCTAGNIKMCFEECSWVSL